MKRLALLLAAMGIVSAAAMAEAPTLKVTNVGQEIEIDNTSGGEDIGESVSIITSVGLSYGDWSFNVAGGKFWSWDSDDLDHKDGRLELDAWRKINDNLKLGYRLRAQDDFDRHYARWDYSNGWFWSAGDIWYEAVNSNVDGKHNDMWRGEVYPLGVKYGMLKAGWFVDYTQQLGDLKTGEKETTFEHQLRVFADLYKSERLALSLEGRFTIAEDSEYKDHSVEDSYEIKDFGRTRVYLGANYAATDNLDVYVKYGYEINNREYINKDGDYESDKYYGEFVAGWNYKF